MVKGVTLLEKRENINKKLRSLAKKVLLVGVLTITAFIGALIIWAAWTCRYECKIGDIKMRDNEIPVSEVEFKTSNFIFEV